MERLDSAFIRLILWALLLFWWLHPTAAVQAVDMLPSTVPVDGEIRAAVSAVLDAQQPAPAGSYYVITDVTLRRVYLVSVVAVPGAEWHLSDVIWMGVVAVDPATMTGALQGTPEFESLTQGVLGDGGGGGGTLELPIFPMDPGKKVVYGTNGIHGGNGWTAVDLVSGSDLGADFASPAVYASVSGTIDYVCRDDYQVAVYTNNMTFAYLHLQDNAFLEVGAQLVRGQRFATLVSGPIPSSAPCGYAEQAANHYHIHWAFKPNGDLFEVAGGWILDLSDGKWRNGSTVVAPGQVLTLPGADNSGGVSPDTGGDSFWDGVVSTILDLAQRLLTRLPSRQAWQVGVHMLTMVRMVMRVVRVMTRGIFDLTIPVAVVSFMLAAELVRMILSAYFFVRKATV